jgi:hypothetical protein
MLQRSWPPLLLIIQNGVGRFLKRIVPPCSILIPPFTLTIRNPWSISGTGWCLGELLGEHEFLVILGNIQSYLLNVIRSLTSSFAEPEVDRASMHGKKTSCTAFCNDSEDGHLLW